MKNIGGYQMVDFSGVTLSADRAVTVKDAKNAEILRSSDKLIIIHSLTVDEVQLSAVSVAITNTGARDGKVYRFVGPNNTHYNITTDDDNVTFTPI